MGAKKLRKLVFVANPHGWGDRFDRKAGRQEKRPRPVEPNQPQFLHRRPAVEPLWTPHVTEAFGRALPNLAAAPPGVWRDLFDDPMSLCSSGLKFIHAGLGR